LSTRSSLFSAKEKRKRPKLTFVVLDLPPGGPAALLPPGFVLRQGVEGELLFFFRIKKREF
jgi:hypothetical protein